jgi:hypothetical protein
MEQKVAPDLEVLPRGHILQNVFSGFALNLPDSQSMHELFVSYLPLEHGVHSNEPGARLTRPFLQLEQLRAPDTENDPG